AKAMVPRAVAVRAAASVLMQGMGYLHSVDAIAGSYAETTPPLRDRFPRRSAGRPGNRPSRFRVAPPYRNPRQRKGSHDELGSDRGQVEGTARPGQGAMGQADR